MSTDDNTRPATEAPAPGYETRDIEPRHAAFGLLGLFGLLAFGLAFAAATLALLQPAHRQAHPMAAEVEPPAPRLQVSPRQQRIAIGEAARRRLEGYAWVDAARQRVRIPITRAMELTAERGWPDATREDSP